MKKQTGIAVTMAAVVAALALTWGAPAIAQGKVAGAKLSQESVKLIEQQQMMLVTAVRQKNDRGGKEDFQRFIEQPIYATQKRWQALPGEDRIHHITCITALQEFANHAADSFKAGHIDQPSNLFRESFAACKKLVTIAPKP